MDLVPYIFLFYSAPCQHKACVVLGLNQNKKLAYNKDWSTTPLLLLRGTLTSWSRHHLVCSHWCGNLKSCSCCQGFTLDHCSCLAPAAPWRSLEVGEVKTTILTKNLGVFRQSGCDGRTSFPFQISFNIAIVLVVFAQHFSICHSDRFCHFMEIIKCRLKGNWNWNSALGWEAAAVRYQRKASVRCLGICRCDYRGAGSMWWFLVQTQGLSFQKYQEVLQGCESLKPWISPASSACWHTQPCCPFHNAFDLSVTHLKALYLHQQGASGLSRTHVSLLLLYPVISYSFHS